MIRLRGLLIIVNCLMPVILAGALTLFAVTLWGVVEAELKPPVNQLIDDAKGLAEEARNAARSIEETAGVVLDEAESMQDAATGMIEPIASFKIDLPPVTLPTFVSNDCKLNLKTKEKFNIGSCFEDSKNLFGGVSKALTNAIRKPFDGVRKSFESVSASIERARAQVNKIRPLGDVFEAQAAQFEARAEELSDAQAKIAARLGDLATTASIVIGFVLAWMAIGYLVTVHDWLAVGWHMLTTGKRP